MFTAFRRSVFLTALVSCLAAPLLAQQLTRSPRTTAPTETQGPVGDCGPLNFTQSASLTPTTPSSIGCNQQGTGYHLDNHWWRAFHLGDSGVEGDFTVCAIEMAVEFADDGDGSGQPLTVNLYQNSEECPFPGGTRTLVGTTTISVTDQSLTTLTIPVAGVLPALSELVVEIAVPDGVPTQDVFFPGSNAAGQTGPTYLSSSACGLPEPVDAASIGFANFHLIMKVFGTQGPLGPKGIDVDPAGNGVIELGENVEVRTHYENLTAAGFDLVGTLTGITAPPGYTGTIVDANAAFGNVPPGQIRSCEDGLDCYAIRYDGAGFGHRDGTLTESLETLVVNAPTGAPDIVRLRTMHIGESFADVPTSHIFYRFIETLLHNQVTGGCGTPNSYCPGDTTLRKQMAVFLLKALLGACYVPPPATGVFSDVPASDPFAPWIEDLADRGITGGCGAGIYCPDDAVRRKQMAVFLLKTLLGSAYTPPAATGIFDDVPADTFRPWIEDLYNRGITGGCAGGPPPAPISYCPENPVTRGQMSAFLTLTFDLLLYRP